MQRQLLALSNDHSYQKSLYSREIAPKTFARFADSPEFRSLELIGYRCRVEEAR
jgi:hypothetical protein